MGPPWAAVVVNYEAGDALRACVASLVADDSAGDRPEGGVGDNGSRDGSPGAVARDFPTVRLVDPGGNVGYAAAANRGIDATTAPIVAVCNPDLVVAPGTAAAMIAALGDPTVGAVGP